MKHNDAIPGPTPLKTPPSAPVFPTGSDITDTTGLRAVIPLMLTRLEHLLGDGVTRGVASRLRALYNRLGNIYRTERDNYTAWLVRALRSDPDWQEQVKSDLGGHRAMRMWHLRQDRLRLPKRPDTETAPDARKTPPRNTAGAGPKTDRYGLFRLAPVTRGAPETQPSPSGRSTCSTGTRHIHFGFPDPKPVPVTPDDLEPRHVPKSNHPTMSRTELTHIWKQIQAWLRDVGCDLFLFDLALDAHAPRRDGDPP